MCIYKINCLISVQSFIKARPSHFNVWNCLTRCYCSSVFPIAHALRHYVTTPESPTCPSWPPTRAARWSACCAHIIFVNLKTLQLATFLPTPKRRKFLFCFYCDEKTKSSNDLNEPKFRETIFKEKPAAMLSYRHRQTNLLFVVLMFLPFNLSSLSCHLKMYQQTYFLLFWAFCYFYESKFMFSG